MRRPVDGCSRSPAYRDVEARIGKYQPHVARTAAQGARLILLPEHAAIVTAQTRRRWLEAVSGWAQQANAILVTGVGCQKSAYPVSCSDDQR